MIPSSTKILDFEKMIDKNIEKLALTLLFLFVFTPLRGQAPRLIVRSDDLAAFHSINRASIDTYVNGITTSVEVIPVAAWLPEAVELLREHSGVDVGVHLAITSEWENIKWRPLTHCPSLTDSNGFFYPMIWPNAAYPNQSVMENDWQLSEIEAEFRAQIELMLKNVPWTSHLSGHMGSMSFDEKVLMMVKKLAKEYNLIVIEGDDYNIQRISYDGPKNTFQEKESSFIKMLDGLEHGKEYLFVDHPALNNEELESVGHIGYENMAEDRHGVTDLLRSEKVKKMINAKGIELIDYKDLLKKAEK